MKVQVIAITLGFAAGLALIVLGAGSAARAVGLNLQNHHQHHPRRRPMVEPAAADPEEVPMKHPHVVCAEPFTPDAFRGDLLK
jgi:hypothetical protein